MRTEWSRLTLESVLEELIDYRGKSPPKSEGGVPVISAKVVKGGRILFPIEQTIDPAYYPVWMTRGLPKIGDVVMTTEGPMGEVARLDAQTAKYALGQRVVCMRGKEGVLDNTFLKFLLASPAQQAILHAFSTGTTVAGISQKSLRSIPIALPPYQYQVVIGRLLGAIDDKIELNRQTNETLEAMARSIFKDWFVDFGPTRAKAEGHVPHLAAHLWSLFPAGFNDEGNPEGWLSGTLEEIVELNPREQLKAGAVTLYLDMGALPTSGPVPEQAVLREFSAGMRFRNSDTLLARITPCLENGKTALVQSLPNDTVGWGSTEFIVLRSRSPIPFTYPYLLARDSAFRSHAIQSMTGSSGRQRVRTEALAAYPVVIPSNDVWRAFGSLTHPMFEKIKMNAEGSITLGETRDLILPKLISGEIRVRDVEKIVGEVL
jgi:type I restriction enzyme, S subunit